jgi:outer membrane protein assembly factor BamB
VVWTLPVGGEVRRLLAADGRLIAVTLDGRIQVYGAGAAQGRITTRALEPVAAPEEAVKLARSLLAKIDDPGGHALVFEEGAPGLIDALLRESRMRVTVIDRDAARVEVARRDYDARGLYGSRITFHQGDVKSFQAPPHFAHLVISPAAQAAAAFASVRPYGGVLMCPAEGAPEAASLERAKAGEMGGLRLFIREGALPGAADWTHQYGDIANTVKSDDRRVRAPLGVLWFGGSSNLDVLPRHGHGPPEQVVGGRLFIEGMNSLSARDVYTGRVIWKHDFKDLGTFGVYYNETYADTPLSTAYNQKHIPGANGRGTNYAATADAVYMAVKGECQVLDSRSGRLVRSIRLREDVADPAQWAFIGVTGGLLVGGDDFAHFSLRTGASASRVSAPIEDCSASAGLAVFDRHSGRLLWRVKARHSFLHNAIVAGGGRIYCIDKLTRHAEGLLTRRGLELPKDYRVVALDAATGRLLWEHGQDVFGTWLGYSTEHDLLLQAGSKASDRLSTEVGEGMMALEGRTGRVRWQDLRRSYTGPCILHHELIFTGANSYSTSGGAFSLLTGEPHLVMNPLTGRKEPWRLNRTYGCNTVIASEHLLTFRSGAAGFYDLESMSGTSNLGGFKSGCTSNLVVANGVLNAPDYTRTCSCAYQNQTSLALIHMPEMEMWSYSQFGLDAKEGERVLRAGLNFGAPGNRRAADGTLWLEHPHVGTGNAPRIGVEGIGKAARWFRRHSSQATSNPGSQDWILASGLIGEVEMVITPALRRPVLGKPPGKSDDDEGKAPGAGKKVAAKVEAPSPAPSKPTDADRTLRPHTVKLHFSEPEQLSAGQRVFSVALQGKTVIEGLDLAREGGSAVREFKEVLIGPELKIGLKASPGSKAPPVISGVEFVAD